MKRALSLLTLLGLLALAGCEADIQPTGDAASGTALPPPSPAAPAAAPAEQAAPAEGQPPAEAQPAEAAPAGDAAPAQASADGEMKKAAVGAGAKGRDYGGPGFVTTPIEAYFRTQDLIVYDAHVPKNMQLYKAEHDNKGPKTHEEFMKVIIKEGGVSLPVLPDDEEYLYVPETEQLMVRRKAPAPAAPAAPQ